MRTEKSRKRLEWTIRHLDTQIELRLELLLWQWNAYDAKGFIFKFIDSMIMINKCDCKN